MNIGCNFWVQGYNLIPETDVKNTIHLVPIHQLKQGYQCCFPPAKSTQHLAQDTDNFCLNCAIFSNPIAKTGQRCSLATVSEFCFYISGWLTWWKKNLTFKSDIGF